MLVVNAGSSSLKLRLLDEDDRVVASCDLPAERSRVSAAAVHDAIERHGLGACDAVGHRIVHGGSELRDPVLIDADVRARIAALSTLAPLHQAKSLDALDAVSAALPDTPAVACFDTAFHRTLEPSAATYALPEEWRERWDLRRFGFHGLSHSWVARRFATGRVVSCHLGAGASLCAIRDGRSVDTTMGFTPLEGLVMATRSGDVDPGLVLWLLEHAGVDLREMAETLEHGSGLLGLAGSGDMRFVLERAAAGDERAALARDVYLHRLRAGIAAMAAALGGIDVLAFTGGVGENAAEVRSGAAAGLGFLGVAIDSDRNAQARGDADISAEAAQVKTYVVTSREDLEIAAEVRALLSGDGATTRAG